MAEDNVLQVATPDIMTQALEKQNVTDKLIAEYKEKYMVMTIDGIDDAKGYKAVDDARKAVSYTHLTLPTN